MTAEILTEPGRSHLIKHSSTTASLEVDGDLYTSFRVVSKEFFYVVLQLNDGTSQGQYPVGIHIFLEPDQNLLQDRLNVPPSLQWTVSRMNEDLNEILVELLGQNYLSFFDSSSDKITFTPSHYQSPSGTFVNGNPWFSVPFMHCPKGTAGAYADGLLSYLGEDLPYPQSSLKLEYNSLQLKKSIKNGKISSNSQGLQNVMIDQLNHLFINSELEDISLQQRKGNRVFDKLKPTFTQMVIHKPHGMYEKVRIQFKVDLESIGPKFENIGFFESYIRSRRWGIIGPRNWLKEVSSSSLKTIPKVKLFESLNGQGSHITIDEVIQIDIPSKPIHDCSILSIRTLPYQVFVDSEMSARIIDASSDINDNSQTVVPFASHIEKPSHQSPASILFNIKKIKNTELFQEPILFNSLVHFRVSFPAYVDMKVDNFELIQWLPPMILTNCEELIQENTELTTNIFVESLANQWALSGGVDKVMIDAIKSFKPIHYSRLSQSYTESLSGATVVPESEYLMSRRLLGPMDDDGNLFNLGIMMIVLLMNIRFFWGLYWTTKINDNNKKKDC